MVLSVLPNQLDTGMTLMKDENQFYKVNIPKLNLQYNFHISTLTIVYHKGH
jgi:hypothetical protein